jgi:radical SAM protein with 4Fe4S-binding SPASM domain
MKYNLFTKIIDDLSEFKQQIKVLRLYKDGEPFLNKNLARMITYANASGHIQTIDTTTNGSLITPERLEPVLKAGINRINISVEGMDNSTYQRVAGVRFDLKKLIENVRWLYNNKGNCEIVIKTIGDVLTKDQYQEFYDTFGDYCDRIFIENFAPCWPEFDIETHINNKIKDGLYGQQPKEVDVCPYIFYGFAVNADGLVSSCFQDWERKLVVGDVRTQSMKSIWNSDKLNKLRLQHLEGKRKENPVCGNCGQLTHCMADDIGPYRETLLEKFKTSMAIWQGQP